MWRLGLKEDVMSCTRHFLNVHWQHHKWQRVVVGTEYVPTREVNMWSRPVDGQAVRCDVAYVGRTCGKTLRNESCICDCAVGEQCPPRLDYLRAKR